MSKKKKTLKQKIVADLRHAQYKLETADSDEAELSSSVSIQTHQTPIPATYAFLASDLRKTGLISLSIIASQIILYFLLVKKIIVLPFITY
ncbi:MAG: hypothetical protein AAB801_03435 [Patescibacteria group bacterium]